MQRGKPQLHEVLGFASANGAIPGAMLGAIQFAEGEAGAGDEQMLSLDREGDTVSAGLLET